MRSVYRVEFLDSDRVRAHTARHICWLVFFFFLDTRKKRLESLDRCVATSRKIVPVIGADLYVCMLK